MSRPFPRFHLLEISLFRWYGFLCGDNYILFEEKFVEVGNQTVKKGRNSRNFYLDRFSLPFFFLVKFFSQLIFLWHGIELRLAPTLLASIVLYTGPVKKKKKTKSIEFQITSRAHACIPLVWSDIKKYPRLLECRSSCNNCFGRVPWRSEPKKNDRSVLPDELLSICTRVQQQRNFH